MVVSCHFQHSEAQSQSIVDSRPALGYMVRPYLKNLFGFKQQWWQNENIVSWLLFCNFQDLIQKCLPFDRFVWVLRSFWVQILMLKTLVDVSVFLTILPLQKRLCPFVLFSYLSRQFLFYLFCVATTTAHSILGTDTLWFVQGRIMCLVFPGFP